MSEEGSDQTVLEITSSFVRERNVLIAMADFSDFYVDYYLHLKDNRIEMDRRHDDLFKMALAAFTLHCVSQPRNQVMAWTINFQDPLVNIFLGGDTSKGSVTGRVFTENVKKAKENVFYQELIAGNRPLRRSVVAFEGNDPLVAAETFYKQSEQRPARYFRIDPEKYVMISAHPDYDRDWFAKVTKDDLRVLDVAEDVAPIEKRAIRWFCGCNQERMFKMLAPVWNSDPEGLFLNEEMIEVNCPRCAAKYRVTREMMEAYVDRTEPEGEDKPDESE